MQDVLSHPSLAPAAPRLNARVRSLIILGAYLLGLLFLVSGGWKMLQPFKTGELLEQAQVPAGLGVLGAAALGTIEVLTALLLFTRPYRRLGGILATALLIFFIGWIGFYYHVLVGRECSCFPLIKRSIGPMFFVSDGIMLLAAVAAWFGSPRIRSLRLPAVALVLLMAVAGSSYGVNKLLITHVQVPNPVVVDGKPADLSKGNVFIFFYDPSCMHCDAAARFMSGFNWADTRVVSIPTVNPQWAASFLHDTKLQAGTSLEVGKMKQAFPFVDPPYGVALKNGQVKQTFGQAEFAAPSPRAQLQALGLVK